MEFRALVDIAVESMVDEAQFVRDMQGRGVAARLVEKVGPGGGHPVYEVAAPRRKQLEDVLIDLGYDLADMEIEERMDPRLETVCAEARRQNGWMVTAVMETGAGGDGLVPHGVVMIRRERSPFGPERAWATAEYGAFPGEVRFHSGHYDLTREDALEDYRRRIR